MEIRHIAFATKTVVDSERSLKWNIRTGEYKENAIETRSSDCRVKCTTETYLAIGFR